MVLLMIIYIVDCYYKIGTNGIQSKWELIPTPKTVVDISGGDIMDY